LKGQTVWYILYHPVGTSVSFVILGLYLNVNATLLQAQAVYVLQV